MTISHEADISAIEQEVAERARPFQLLRDQIHEVVTTLLANCDRLICAMLIAPTADVTPLMT